MSIRRLFCTVLPAVLLFAPACGSADDSSVIIVGSTSVQPYIEQLAELYEEFYDEVAVRVLGGGSSTGITSALNRTADIGMSSRSLSAEENEKLRSIEIAKDGLALVVHPENPVTDLTLEQIRDIYSRQITNWNQLGGADNDIYIISREEGSGTRSAFQELVMGSVRISDKAITQNSNGSVRQLVSGNKYMIGFISLGFAEHQEGLAPVQAVSIDGVAPTQENVISGHYSLYRSFLFVTESEPAGLSKHFIEFVLSPAGQQLLLSEGLVTGQ